MRRRHTIPETTTEAPLDEDLEITREIENIDYKVGDHVVYPHHGAGKVLKKEVKDILGEKRHLI